MNEFPLPDDPSSEQDDGTVIPMDASTREPSKQSRLLNELHRRKDEESWKAFVDEFSPRPLQFLEFHGIDQRTREEICENVFKKISLRIEDLDALPSQPSEWLYRIMHSLWHEVATEYEIELQDSKLASMPADQITQVLFSTHNHDDIARQALQQTKKRLQQSNPEPADLDIRVFDSFISLNIGEEDIAANEGITKTRVWLIIARVRQVFTEERQRLAGEIA